MNVRMLNRHAAAAHDWLRPRLSETGAWRDEPDAVVEAYYKAPWWLAAAGDVAGAQQNLAYIERVFMQADGDLRPIRAVRLRERYPLMPHAHIAIGALHGERMEQANRLLDFLERHQHGELGGWGDRADTEPPRRVDAISSACIGLAFLEGGRIERARRGGAFLDHLVAAQPAPATDFYTTVVASGVPVTEFDNHQMRVDRRVTFATRFQVWHAIGFPIMLLARLYEHDREAKWLHLAEHFVDLFDKSEQAWIDLSVGKAACGFAFLYRATGNKGYRERAVRALRGIVSWQDADGGWLGCLDGSGGSSAAPTTIGYETTTELAMWLAVVTRILAEADSMVLAPAASARPSAPLGPLLIGASRWSARQRRLAPARRRRTEHRIRRVLGRPQP